MSNIKKSDSNGPFHWSYTFTLDSDFHLLCLWHAIIILLIVTAM